MGLVYGGKSIGLKYLELPTLISVNPEPQQCKDSSAEDSEISKIVAKARSNGYWKWDTIVSALEAIQDCNQRRSVEYVIRALNSEGFSCSNTYRNASANSRQKDDHDPIHRAESGHNRRCGKLPGRDSDKVGDPVTHVIYGRPRLLAFRNWVLV